MTNKEIDGFYNQIGQNIRRIRKSNGLKQEQLAELFDLSRTSIVNMEAGKQRPTLHFVYILARELGATLDEVIPMPDGVLTQGASMIPEKDRSALREIMSKI